MNHSFYVEISLQLRMKRTNEKRNEKETEKISSCIYKHTYTKYIYNHNIDRSDYIEDNLLNESKCHDDNKKGAIRFFLYILFPMVI